MKSKNSIILMFIFLGEHGRKLRLRGQSLLNITAWRSRHRGGAATQYCGGARGSTVGNGRSV
jgi:hypothetical protein